MPTNLFIIKHGESIITTLNSKLNVPSDDQNILSENGIHQMVSLSSTFKTSLKDQKLKIISSPMKATLQASNILSEYLRTEVNIDDRLSDRLQNREGISITKYRQLQDFAATNPYLRPEGGESFLEHKARTLQWFAEFLTSIENNVSYFIISHGTTIEQLQSFIFGYNINSSKSFFSSCYPGRFHHWIIEKHVENFLSWELRGSNTTEVLSNLPELNNNDLQTKDDSVMPNISLEERELLTGDFKTLEVGQHAAYHR